MSGAVTGGGSNVQTASWTTDAHAIQVLYDAAGNPIRAQVHGNIEGTVTANGITLREIEHGQTFYDLTDGSQTLVGLIFRVFLHDGGTVIADVGRLVFDAEGNVTFEAGPHPALHGDFAALCAALSRVPSLSAASRRMSCYLPTVPLACQIRESITVSSGHERSPSAHQHRRS
jgi:hypothetical protein